MPAWTSSDLTDPQFIATKLSADDRNYALYAANRDLVEAQKKLVERKAALDAADEANNNKPPRSLLIPLRAKVNDETLSDAERDAAQNEIARITDERAKFSSAAENALSAYTSIERYVNNLTVGISNLKQAGAVDPGTNMFAAPPGYDGRKAPAAEVNENQNPNPVPTPDNQVAELAVPTPVAGEATLAAEREIVNVEEQRQLETELGATRAEADFLVQAQKEADQTEYETQVGATQSEADFIAKAQLEANQNEYAFGGTQDEADFIIKEQKRVSAAETNAGATGDEALAAFQEAQDAKNAADEDKRRASRGTTSAVYNAQSEATQQDSTNAYAQNDWRVRLQLAPGSKYLYNADKPGILEPLVTTRGVLFPYTPAINVTYAASYDAATLTHSNYKIFQYGSSSVDQVSISCDFTAQDAMEAKYLLAVIHFFRSVTKMFYGQDKNPLAGTPPPLCYLTGMGQFQFDRHPLVITNFNMNLPTDVDYIRAANATNVGVNTGGEVPRTNTSNPSKERLNSSTTPIGPGGTAAPPAFPATPGGSIEATYVPTKMQIQISAYPIVTRNDISNNFSLEQYATGELLRGSKNKGGAGIW